MDLRTDEMDVHFDLKSCIVWYDHPHHMMGDLPCKEGGSLIGAKGLWNQFMSAL